MNKPTTLELTIGQHATITDAGQIRAGTGPNLDQAMAWSRRQLIFREAPLSHVIAEFNRYHSRPIRIEDPELAALRINGVFDTRDVASLVEYLQRYRKVRVERERDGGQILTFVTP